MTIKNFKRLSKLRLQQLGELEEKCTVADKVSYSVFKDAEFNFTSVEPAFFFALVNNKIIGAVTLFLPGDASAEISALVAPEYRKQGIFKELLKQARRTVRKLKCTRLLLVSTPGIPATDAVIKKLRCSLDTSEYKMLLRENIFATAEKTSDCEPAAPHITAHSTVQTVSVNTASESISYMVPRLVPVTQKDVPELAQMEADFFASDLDFSLPWIESLLPQKHVHLYMLRVGDSNVGGGAFSLSSDCCSVFGIGIKTEFRGHGYGKVLMQSLLAAAPVGIPVSLQVSSHNAVAFAMYKALGFEITAQQDFYLLK